MVDDISHEGLRILLREEGVSFQRTKTWKTSRDPDYAAKKARVEHLYAIADGEVIPEDVEPEVVLSLGRVRSAQPGAPPRPAVGRARRQHKDADREPRPRVRATYARPHGVRHLFAAYDLARDKLYGHVKLKKNRTKFLHFCRYLRTLYPRRGRLCGRPPAFDREAGKQRNTVERRINKSSNGAAASPPATTRPPPSTSPDSTSPPPSSGRRDDPEEAA